MEEYIHEDMNEEIRSISGYYQYLEEGTLSFNGRDVLYLVGVGVVDNSCCGRALCPLSGFPDTSLHGSRTPIRRDALSAWLSQSHRNPIKERYGS
jgi:hypothetical protein